MKKFAFTLEPVLDHRERIEDEKQQVHAERLRELHRAQEDLARLNDEFARHARALREDHRSFDAEDLRLHYAHLEYLDRAITAQEGVVGARKAACERARLDLVDASKDRQVLEKLKERKREAHLVLENRLEQRDLDDANARRHGRAQSTPGGSA